MIEYALLHKVLETLQLLIYKKDLVKFRVRHRYTSIYVQLNQGARISPRVMLVNSYETKL